MKKTVYSGQGEVVIYRNGETFLEPKEMLGTTEIKLDGNVLGRHHVTVKLMLIPSKEYVHKFQAFYEVSIIEH